MSASIAKTPQGIIITDPNGLGIQFDDHLSISSLQTMAAEWLKENPKKVERWVNVYEGEVLTMHKTEERAEKNIKHNIRARIRVTYFEGEGLEE